MSRIWTFFCLICVLSNTFTMPFTCLLCSAANTSKTFSSKNSLSIHERTVHPNNKIIPHSRCLTSPSLYDIYHFKQLFVMQLKARLQFYRSELQVNTLKMKPFSEEFFIILFYNEPTFQYSSVKRMYTCKFKGGQGYAYLPICRMHIL